MAVRAALLVFLLLLPLLPAPAAAQNEVLYDFEFTGPSTRAEVGLNAPLIVPLTFRDLSRDTTNIVPGAPPVGVLLHSVEFTVTPGYEDNAGWYAPPMSSLTTTAGDTKTVDFQIQVHPQANNPFYRAIVNATITTQNGVFYRDVTMLFFTKGIPGFLVQSGSEVTVGAREIGQSSLRVYNFGVFPRAFDFSLVDNPCPFKVAPPASVVVPARTFQDVFFTVLGPDSQFDPLGFDTQSCLVTMGVAANDNPALVQTQTISGKVAPGVSIDPMAVFWFLVLALLVVLLVLFARRRKERLEERLLGKPQKPWLIPVEQVYLRELKHRDPRAWYVVRHFLMEEEYRSALLWFKSYKVATKGDRKKERLILRHEDRHATWKAKWAKAVAKPTKRADRFEAQLQAKLDRQAKSEFASQSTKQRKLSAKIRESHARNQKRALESWEKVAAKARKKGKPVPPQPVAAAPELPAEPKQGRVLLADHKWAKKAARFRKRMQRKQGDLEVKFEKADARYLARLRRKVGRIGRKLDDPEFAREHPLLRGEPKAE